MAPLGPSGGGAGTAGTSPKSALRLADPGFGTLKVPFIRTFGPQYLDLRPFRSRTSPRDEPQGQALGIGDGRAGSPS